ncbi:MAG: hypothetical protein ACR2PH_01705, partial [Desulfobulbia bacterium]
LQNRISKSLMYSPAQVKPVINIAAFATKLDFSANLKEPYRMFAPQKNSGHRTLRLIKNDKLSDPISIVSQIDAVVYTEFSQQSNRVDNIDNSRK